MCAYTYLYIHMYDYIIYTHRLLQSPSATLILSSKEITPVGPSPEDQGCQWVALLV